jgi:hypothetical protein
MREWTLALKLWISRIVKVSSPSGGARGAIRGHALPPKEKRLVKEVLKGAKRRKEGVRPR